MNQSCYAFLGGPVRQKGAALVVGLILLVVITLIGVSAMQSTTLQEKMAGNLRDSNLSFQAAEVGLRFCENILTQDYQFQVAALNLGAINTPPQARPLDQTWQIDNPATPVVEGPAVWLWSLDENQAGFPNTNLRLDPNPNPANAPSTSTPFWWAEAGRGAAWWAAANNIQVLPANTLDGLSANPGCVMEAYIYAPTDTTPAAAAFKRSRAADGIVVRNETAFSRQRNYYRITARGLGGSNTAVTMLQSGIYRLYYVAAP
ncbi:MAG: hypothetical protein IPN66_02220 [Candidatus Competibacteraceae bacterium]|nr:hypothetical protein [Candidatus Competibacteraceae bacterium]MBK7984066.1 hypothetical protein [Candidatus Competibacteraceae bacterium]MBK8896043.1 hypothetical protein [Candidatus Competibacteraceae bacterium]MBK8963543.1 hypothetical protein [Candidatus Competibacteraceae bacterium]